MRLGILLFLAAAIVTAQDKPQPAGASVSGEVINVTTGSPIPNADVSYWVSSKSVYVKTDGAGHYRFTDLTPRFRTPGSRSTCAFAACRRAYPPVFDAWRRAGPDGDRRAHPAEWRDFRQGARREQLTVPNMAVFLLAREYSSGSLRYVYASGTESNDEGAYSFKGVEPGRGYLLVAQTRTRSWMRFRIRLTIRVCASQCQWRLTTQARPLWKQRL